jgi:hypothetical protein
MSMREEWRKSGRASLLSKFAMDRFLFTRGVAMKESLRVGSTTRLDSKGVSWRRVFF